mmetsp:Transcript_69094/g.200055  ORF Transcript_69094/g.200055 Transcript_69094/m.200055 type:complete len:213 (+) Transcript_69094:102-740(+)
MAQRDPRVWGDAAGEFRPRPLQAYHQHSVGFAEPAGGPLVPEGMARSCPARDLALAMSLAFVSEFIMTVTAAGGEAASKNPHRNVWCARMLEPGEGGDRRLLDPSEIKLHMNGCSAFALCKEVEASKGDTSSTATPERHGSSEGPTDGGEASALDVDAQLAKSRIPMATGKHGTAESLHPPSQASGEAFSSSESLRSGRRVVKSKSKCKPKK